MNELAIDQQDHHLISKVVIVRKDSRKRKIAKTVKSVID
jgi:hypothetical protein